MLDSDSGTPLRKLQLIAALGDGEKIWILKENCEAYVEVKKGQPSSIREVELNGG